MIDIKTQEHPDSTWSARARIGTKTVYGYGQNEEAAIKDVVESLEQEDMPKHEPMSEHKEDTMEKVIIHERMNGKAMSVVLLKSDVEQLLSCRAALRDCLEQMERTPKSAVSPDFIAAIDDGRKALGKS